MSDTPLGTQLEAAFQAARDMDVPLSLQLDYVANAVRSLSEEFASGVDNLVARLHSAEAGEDAPRVGEKMPPFTLPDDKGRFVSLGEAERPRRRHLQPRPGAIAAEHARARPTPVGRQGQIVAITPGAPFEPREEQANAPFPVLTDLDNGYALSLNLAFWVGDEMKDLMTLGGFVPNEGQGNDAWFLPIPATFVVGQDGRVKARYIDPDYRKRMAIEDLISTLRS
jgi:peroxiredoxin